MARAKYIVGRQPCTEFEAQREGNGFAEWDNVHECFGPFCDSERPRCGGTVSFCTNCYSDHHSDGWDACLNQR